MPEQTPTVLVIDNDDGLTALLEARLADAGLGVEIARTGAQGLAAFDACQIDLVVSDLNMPAGDGVTVARQIRKHSPVPIVIVTGFQDEYRDQLVHIPHLTIVHKPFSTEELIDLIDAELEMAGLRASAEAT